MYKWLEYKPNTSVKNNFGIKRLASKKKFTVKLARWLRIYFINFRRRNNG